MKRIAVLCFLVFTGTILPAAEPIEALGEVNRQRAERGLPPYAYDSDLTQAAGACAAYRAEHRLHGHTGSDFAFLPAGSHADAAGCAAWQSGFGACAVFETQYHTAGAAFVVGKDGLRYCQLFVRKGPPTQTVTQIAPRIVAIEKNVTQPALPKTGTITCTRMKRGQNGDWVPDVTWTEPEPAWLNPGTKGR